MLIENVVMNASPFICLSESDLIHLLPKLFKEIVVPDIVCNEIVAKGKIDNASQSLHACNWLKQVKDVPLLPSVLSWDLGKGESAVLSYAIKHPGFWAGIDDREARRCASSLGCQHIGTVGIILLAKRRGIVPTVYDNLKKLQDAGLWLSETFIKEVCRMAGE